jgi:hypothetical protein
MGRGDPVSCPTENDIYVLEVELKLPLPDAYKQFVVTYGPGQIGRYFNIRAPGYGLKSDADLAALIRLFRIDEDMYIDIFQDVPFIQRCTFGMAFR